jgi:type IV pilus assembly protein PilQ
MSSLSRLIRLTMFAAVGAGIAICVALSEPPHSAATAKLSAAQALELVPHVTDSAATTAQKSHLISPSAAAGPPRESRIASESWSPTWPDAIGRYFIVRPSPLIAIRTWSPADRIELPVPPSPDELPGPSLAQAEVPSPKIEQQVPAAGSPETRQQVRDNLDELRALLDQGNKDAKDAAKPEPVAKPSPAGRDPNAAALPNPPDANAPPAGPTPRKPKPKITKLGEGDAHLTLDFQDAEIRDVLDLISREGNLNILPSNSVKGKVSASLHDVDLQTALAAILKSTGYVTRRNGGMIYVGTPRDFQDLEQALDKVGTRIYQTNYVRAADLQALITPLLTQGVETVSVTPPTEIGIAADNTKAGGDTFAGGEAVLVRDYETVLAQVDQVVAEIDRRPMQVAIEAMILSVKLDDQNSFGINFQALRDNTHIKLTSGTPPTSLAGIDTSNGGLNFAFLDSSLSLFLEALESVGDTNVIATPRLTCVNKHRAEILIGSQLGYVNSTVTETSTAQNVNFLEVGAQLRLRPFISSDGLIRMEVHPELSTGQVKLQGGFTLPKKDVTQVTTNVMVRDGATVIIGGLMREDLTSNTTQIPLLGSLPGVGFLFRQKSDRTQRSEILVLITPHIIYDAEACAEGAHGAADFHRRQAVYADQMSPLSKVHLGRQYYRLAQQAWSGGDQTSALRFVDLAIHFDPADRAAIDLRVDILTGNHFDEHTAVKFPKPVDAAHPGEGHDVAPWMLDELQGPGGPPPSPQPLHPLDPGVPARRISVERPRYFEAP